VAALGIVCASSAQRRPVVERKIADYALYLLCHNVDFLREDPAPPGPPCTDSAS
jgi:hypothetical protein